MPTRWAIASGNWSSLSTWNDSGSLGFPTASDDIWANSFTVNVDTSFQALTLNNSATPLIVPNNRIPVMTSNTTPSGVASANSNSTNAYFAFDQNTGTSWTTPSGNTTGILTYQFPSGIVAKRYSVRSIGGTTNTPRNWTFEGSNDGTSWITLETVTGQAYGATGNYTSTILANTSSYDRYRLNVTANNGASNLLISDFEITDSTSTGVGGLSGGSFNFNSGSISGSVTSTSPLSAGATNLITVTATTGSVGLTLGGNVTGLGVVSQIFNHTGNCDFRLSGTRFTGGSSGANALCINKSSNGTITIVGDVWGGTANVASSAGLTSTGGNTVVIGNVFGNVGTGIIQSVGNLTISGSVTGGSAGSTPGITFSGTSTTITGNVAGSAAAIAIITTAPTFITGNVTGSAFNGISTSAPVIVTGSVVAQGAAAAINAGSTATFINVSGSVISSATANGITATNASAVVNLAGNMVNTSGKTAIYCQNLFLSDTATTQAQFFTIGSQDRTLYSADTFPNLPSASNVRFGTTYGPGSGNTGTLRMASPQDVRSGVLTDNTTGSAILSIESLSNEVQTSSDPFAQRLRDIPTVDIIGNLLTAFKK